MKRTIIFPILLLFANYLVAQDSLMHYLALSAQNNPTVLQRYAEYEAALQKIPQAGSLPDPQLGLDVFLSPMELVSGNQIADIGLMQMFPWFGVLKNAKDEMSLMAKAKFEVFRDAKLQLFFDVQRTWYELNKVEQNIRMSGKSLELLQTTERLSVVRFKANAIGPVGASNANTKSSSNQPNAATTTSGMGSMDGNAGRAPASKPGSMSSSMGSNTMGSTSGGSGLSDVYRIQISISELKNAIELLRSQQKTLTAQFNAFLNRPQSTTITLPDSLTAGYIDPELLVFSDSLLVSHPMLEMVRFEGKSLEARKQMVSRMGYPMIGVGLSYSVIGKSNMSGSHMNGRDMVMPMFTVTLPIYRKKYKAMAKEVELMQGANRQAHQATSNTLQTEYYQALQMFFDAQRRMDLYADQYELASKSMEILLSSYSSSGSDLTSVIQVQQQKLDYGFKQVEAVADYNIAIAWIKRLLAQTQIQ